MSAPADPVRGLMRQHRELCEQAVDPLEIAAGLEAHGVTDRTAARFKHRDVFSLAEELYARVPREEQDAVLRGAESLGNAGGDEASALGRRAASSGRAALPLVPGGLCVLTVGALGLVPSVPPFARLSVALVGAVAVLLSVRYVARAVLVPVHLPLPRFAGLWTCWLAGFSLYGDRLLASALAGGPDVPDLARALLGSGAQGLPPGSGTAVGVSGTALGLALAVAPAVWCARWFAVRARRRLAVSVSLEEFAAGVRPLLAGVFALFALALLVVQGVAHALARTANAYAGARGDTAHALSRAALDGTPGSGTGSGPGAVLAQPVLAGPLGVSTALGVLLFAGLLLTAHGFGPVVTAVLRAACAAEVLALTAVLAARVPGLGVLARPVELAVAACGTYVVTVTVCACAAFGLLAYAVRALTGASAHHRAAEHA